MEFRDIICIHSVNNSKSRLATCRASASAAGSILPLCKCTVFTAVLLVLPKIPEDGDNKNSYVTFTRYLISRRYGGCFRSYVWDGAMDGWLDECLDVQGGRSL